MADPRVLFGETRLPQFLGGRRVDYYIPPEVRQGIGALLQVGDMLNPVSAWRGYEPCRVCGAGGCGCHCESAGPCGRWGG